MGTILRRNSRTVLAISMIAALFALIAACGDSSTEPSAPAAAQVKSTAAATVPPAPDLSTAVPAISSQSDEVQAESPAEPPEPTPSESPSSAQSGSNASPTTAPVNNSTSTPSTKNQSTPSPLPTEPVLVNTPVPVATDLAPDFTLPSIQDTEYTLSNFRGEQPVLVVFYRAYW